MREIKFTDYNFNKLHQGKLTTVRLGQKEYKLDEKVILSSSDNTKRSVISKITVTRISDLSLEQIKIDGFKNVQELINELENCYAAEVCIGDIITLVEFHNDGENII